MTHISIKQTAWALTL